MRPRPFGALALAAVTAGCLSYTRPPAVPTHPDPPAPIRIYSLWERNRFEDPDAVQSGLWRSAAEIAIRLHRAGFTPIVVRSRAEIPPGAPFLVQVYPDRDRCRKNLSPLPERPRRGDTPRSSLPSPMSLLSVGLIPAFHCDSFGDAFELYRSLDAPAQLVDTYWTVEWIFGWLAIPIGLSEGHFAGFLGNPPDSVGSDREAPALGAALLEALDEP